jgi:hypothetical protein
MAAWRVEARVMLISLASWTRLMGTATLGSCTSSREGSQMLSRFAHHCSACACMVIRVWTGVFTATGLFSHVAVMVLGRAVAIAG